MKKSYVKPVMESEAFVANEYVGACNVIKCISSDHMDNDGNSEMFVYRPNAPVFVPDNIFFNTGDGDGDGFYYAYDVALSKKTCYNGNLFNHDGSMGNQGKPFHYVEIIDSQTYGKGNSFEINGQKYGPNAS